MTTCWLIFPFLHVSDLHKLAAVGNFPVATSYTDITEPLVLCNQIDHVLFQAHIVHISHYESHDAVKITGNISSLRQMEFRHRANKDLDELRASGLNRRIDARGLPGAELCSDLTMP